MKSIRRVVIFFFVAIILFLSYQIVFRRLILTLKYGSKTEYEENGGLWGSPITRCLCYGTVKLSDYDPASDPPTYNYCDGWVDEKSCELKEAKGSWSRIKYIKLYGEKFNIWDWLAKIIY